ncbi:MAG: acyl-CoA dehydrogenase family protein, partial [Sphingobium sp.]
MTGHSVPRVDDIDAPTPVSRAEAILPALATLGVRYDAAPIFPVESMKLIAAVGLHRTFAPAQSGGEAFADRHAQILCMMSVLRIVGRADLSVGRLYEGHVNALALLDWYGSPTQKAALGQSLAMGAFYGMWATEPPPGVRIVETGDGPVLHGAKSFATGAGGLAHAIVTAQPAEGARRLVVVPADDPARADLSG